IPVAVLVLILAAVLIRESTIRESRRIDFVGASSLGVGLTFAMLGITEGQYWGWTGWTSGSFAGVAMGVPEFFAIAAVAFLVFLVWEPRAPAPIVSFAALRQRNIWVSNLNGVLVGMTMFLMFTVLILLAEYPAPGFGLSELNAGLALVPAVIGMMAFGPILGRAIPRFGPKPVMIAGFLLIALGALGMIVYNRSIYQIAAFAVPVMVGNVGVLISMSNIIVLSVDPRTMGVQTGMNQTFRNLGSAIGPVLVSSILAAYAFTLYVPIGPGVSYAFENYRIVGYAVVFALVAVVGILGAVVSFGLRNYRFHADGTRSGEAGHVANASAEAASTVPAATESAR
ncbi:major facilitator transporter, partial [mine drainage metagenome]